MRSWSYSRLTDFEKCKKYFWLKHDQRIPEPERPLPQGKTEHANDRGTRVHTSCEEYINGTAKTLCAEAEMHFGPQIDLLRTLYADGLVSLEGEWAHSTTWDPCSWVGDWEEVNDPEDLGFPITKVKELPERPLVEVIYAIGQGRGKPAKHYVWTPPWLRLKLDALVMHDERTATVIDFKTGRKFGNEIKHGEQLQLYQLSTFIRYPQIETVFAELWYLDQNEVTSQKFTRQIGMRYREKFNKRAHALSTCNNFAANPNKFTCKWCMYGPWGSGDCTVGVK